MRKLILIIAACVLPFVFAAPALASSNPQPVTATFNLPTTISMTGISTNITFQALSPGNAQAPHAEVFSATTNDGNGATVTLSTDPGTQVKNAFWSALNGGSDTIPNQGHLTINEASTSPGVVGVDSGSWGAPGSSEAHTIGTFNGPGTKNFDESWILTYDPNQSANNYTETFDYTATAN